MALDFPSTPANGQVYTSNGRSWMWSATSNAWMSSSQFSAAPTTVILSLSANTANLVNNTMTSLAFDTETLDTDSWHAASNSRIVIGRTGNYVISGKVYIWQHADMGAYTTSAAITVNGAVLSGYTQVLRVPGSFTEHYPTAGAYLTAGDYVELKAYSQYLGKVISNSTVTTSMTLVSAGLTGATGATGINGPDSPYTDVLEVDGTATQNVNNLAINPNTALVNFTSIHASNNNITGITGGIPGRRLTLRNGSSNSSIYLIVRTANTSSDANNRFYTHRLSTGELGNGRAVDLLWINTYGWVISQTSFA